MTSRRRLKIRHRSAVPTPWKWEIYDGEHLITASHKSYASQAEAHNAGMDALARLPSEAPHRQRRFKETDPREERLAEEAKRLRDEAKSVPPSTDSEQSPGRNSPNHRHANAGVGG